MPWAADDRIKKVAFEGAIEITENQYDQALDAMRSGKKVRVQDGEISFVGDGMHQIDHIADLKEALSGAVNVAQFSTGSDSERVSTIPIDTTRQVIFSQYVGDLPAGAIIVVQAEFEATNDHDFNVMMMSGALLCAGETDTTGTEITEINGRNITPGMHHDTHQIVGTYKVSGDVSGAYINVIAYSAASQAGSGDDLKVEQDYGRLSVLIMKPVIFN